MVFDFSLPVFSEKVEAKRVFFGFVEAEELGAKCRPLSGIDYAFKDGVLDALAIVEAGFCDAVESPSPGLVDRGYVVGDEDQHFYFQMKGG
jgi:hypothetical protein